MKVDTLEGTPGDDNFNGLARTHKVHETWNGGVREMGQWRSVRYGRCIQFEPLQCRSAFEEAGYVGIEWEGGSKGM